MLQTELLDDWDQRTVTSVLTSERCDQFQCLRVTQEADKCQKYSPDGTVEYKVCNFCTESQSHYIKRREE